MVERPTSKLSWNSTLVGVTRRLYKRVAMDVHAWLEPADQQPLKKHSEQYHAGRMATPMHSSRKR